MAQTKNRRVAAEMAGCLVGAGLLIAAGCGGGETGSGGSKTPEGVRDTVIHHEECGESGHKVEKIDVTGDGKPDIIKVYDGTREICRATDLNHDGRADLYEYFDSSGQLRRREYDFDDNTIINQIDFYENGKLVRRELDTNNQGRIDTWDYFDPSTGKLVKRERDSTGDGRVDQWWTFDGDKVTIAMDRNGDGQPDPDATVTLGGGGEANAKAAPDAGALTTDAAAAPPPPPPPPATTDLAPSAPAITDAGVPGKPQRGGAKR